MEQKGEREEEISLECHETLSLDDLERDENYYDKIASASSDQPADLCVNKAASPSDKNLMIKHTQDSDSSHSRRCNDDEVKPLNIATDTDSGCHGSKDSETENPIVTCGKVMMDHIIDQLYYSSKFGHPLQIPPTRPIKNEMTEQTTKEMMRCERENKGVFENLKMSRDQLERKLLQQGPGFNVPKLTTIKSEKIDSVIAAHLGSKGRARKRCYSESVVTSKSESYRKEEMAANSEKVWTNNEGNSEGGRDDTGTDSYDEDQQVRKSKRRNRGQRYQELINEGIIQPSKDRIAARKTETTVKRER